MIFVSVGTHEQQFNRLVQYMDNWASSHSEEVLIQTGYSTYEPRYCAWKKMFSYDEMAKNVADARIVVTHGGPSSFIAPLQIGKTPIVVPRMKKYGEHVNNHQVDFTKAVCERMGSIILVEEIDKLGCYIEDYNELVEKMKSTIPSNNAHFCNELDRIVGGLFDNNPV